jgi:endoglycosylceramidase
VRRVRRTRAAAGLAIGGLILFAASAQAGPTAPLGHSGRWITDAKGRVAILHGVNMVSKRPPYAPSATGFGDDDAAFLQRNGFDAVRLGLIYKAVEPAPGSYDDGYLSQIAGTEADLARHGVFSQLDFHQDMYNERFQGEGWPDWAVQDDGVPNVPQAGFPSNYFLNAALIRAFDNFWANSPGPGGVGLQDRYAAAWAHVASRFAAAPHTLGFDLLNEPWPGTPWASCFVPGGCPAFDTGSLAPFYQRVIAQIRRVDPGKLIWYEPNVLFDFGADSSVPAVGDGPVGFSFHVYCVPGSFAIAALNSLGCPGIDDHVFANADTYAQKTGDALMLSEFGATDDLDTIRLNVGQADRHMVSWEYWHYCECLDPTTSGSGTQAIVIDPSQPPSGANVKQAKLDVLAEPYPQVVAGTPTSYGFDEAARRFTLAYSTRGPTGKSFALRTKRSKRKRSRAKFRQTQIFLGRNRYPSGYTASVDGGGIASKRRATLLRVIACPGRSNVSVTVLPASAGSRSHGDCRVTPRRKRRGR